MVDSNSPRHSARCGDMLDLIPEMILNLDNDLNIITANQAGRSFFGGDVAGKNMNDFCDDDIDFRDEKNQNPDDIILYKEIWLHGVDQEKRCLAWNIRVLRVGDEQDAAYLLSGRDITGQKQALKDISSLKEAEQSLIMLIGNLPGMVYRALNDKDATIIYASNGCKKITGFEPDEVINNKNRSFSAFTHKDDFARVLEEIQNALKEKQHFEIEYRLTDKYNQEKWVWERGAPVCDEAGNILFTEGFVMDITGRKKDAEALRQNARQNDQILQTMLDGFILADTEGRIIRVNQAYSNLVGYTIAELQKMNIRDLEVKIGKEEVGRRIEQMVSQGRDRFETQHKHKDGRILDLNVSIVIMKTGATPLVAAFMHDITERKRTEVTLRESEARLSEAQRIAKMGDFMWDLETGTVTWSEAMFDLLKYEKDEKVDYTKVNSEIHHPDDLERVTAWLNQCIASGENELIPNEYRLVRKDGETIHVRTQGIISREDGRPKKVFASLQDITGQKLAHDKLRESEERLRAFFDSGVIGTIFGDIYGGIERANDKYLEIIGYSRAEVESGQVKWDAITPPEFHELEAQKIKEAQKYGVCTPYEKEYIRKDSSRIWVIVGYILLGEKREKSVAFILDIQKTKEYQQELENRNHFIQTVLDNLPIGVALNRYDSGEATYINKKFEEIYGWPPEDLTDVNRFFEKVYPDKKYRESLMKNVLADIRSGDPSRMEWEGIRARSKSGRTRIINAKNIPLPEQNLMISTVLDDTDRYEYFEELKRSRHELQLLADHLQTAREDERAAIARELHDELGQILTALGMDLSMLRNEVRAETGAPDRDKIINEIRIMEGLVDATIQNVRKIITELRPDVLENLGLIAAIEVYLEEFRERSGIECRFEHPETDIALTQDRAIAVFRILQEALTNVARHSEAGVVRIKISLKAGMLIMRIADNGVGIPHNRLKNSGTYGLIGMRERASYLEGGFEIRGAAGKGTEIKLQIPLDPS